METQYKEDSLESTVMDSEMMIDKGTGERLIISVAKINFKLI